MGKIGTPPLPPNFFGKFWKINPPTHVLSPPNQTCAKVYECFWDNPIMALIFAKYTLKQNLEFLE